MVEPDISDTEYSQATACIADATTKACDNLPSRDKGKFKIGGQDAHQVFDGLPTTGKSTPQFSINQLEIVDSSQPKPSTRRTNLGQWANLFKSGPGMPKQKMELQYFQSEHNEGRILADPPNAIFEEADACWNA